MYSAFCCVNGVIPPYPPIFKVIRLFISAEMKNKDKNAGFVRYLEDF